MYKSRPAWVFGVLLLAALGLLGSMPLTWFSVDAGRVTGFQFARGNPALFAVPAAGVMLLIAAWVRSPHIRLAAIVAGAAMPAYLTLNVTQSLAVHGGLATWLILVGAAVMGFGMAPHRRLWRAVGGTAVLVGFFAPWTADSAWHDVHQLPPGIVRDLLWDLLGAGCAGVIAAMLPRGGKLAAAAAGTVFATVAIVVGLALAHIFGAGAWVALAASAAALFVGLVGRARA
jgi:hypothetical protein